MYDYRLSHCLRTEAIVSYLTDLMNLSEFELIVNSISSCADAAKIEIRRLEYTMEFANSTNAAIDPEKATNLPSELKSASCAPNLISKFLN